MNGGGGQTLIEQEVVDNVHALLGSAEYQSSGRRRSNEEVVECLLLLVLVDPDDLRKCQRGRVTNIEGDNIPAA